MNTHGTLGHEVCNHIKSTLKQNPAKIADTHRACSDTDGGPKIKIKNRKYLLSQKVHRLTK